MRTQRAPTPGTEGPVVVKRAPLYLSKLSLGVGIEMDNINYHIFVNESISSEKDLPSSFVKRGGSPLTTWLS